MTAMDMNAMATALASKYASLTPPSGEAAIRESTSEPPQTITKTPFVLVMRTDPATFEYHAMQQSGHVPFEVLFLLEKSSDLARQMVRLQKWEFVVADATLAGIHLGLSDYTAIARTMSSEVGDVEYGGQTWAGIRLVVDVQTDRGITPTA